MTVAICLNCGARKFGALVPCMACGFEPKDEEEKAKSVLLSDHNLSAADLGNVSERIKSGQRVNFDPASVEQFVESVRVVEQEGLLRGPKATLLTCGVVVALGVLLGLLVTAASYFLGG